MNGGTYDASYRYAVNFELPSSIQGSRTAGATTDIVAQVRQAVVGALLEMYQSGDQAR